MPRIVTTPLQWLLLPLLSATLVAQAVVQEPDPAATAAAVRAAMLHKIAGYVEIGDGKTGEPPPAPAPAPATAPKEYRIGIVGSDATAAAALKTLPGKYVRGAKIAVVAVSADDAAAGRAAEQCDLLYIATAVDAKTVAKIVAQQKDKPVALVCAQPGFAAAGGGVQLFVKDGCTRFEVNTEALQRQGLHASSQLLKHSVQGPKR
jgi:hypothetical protein